MLGSKVLGVVAPGVVAMGVAATEGKGMGGFGDNGLVDVVKMVVGAFALVFGARIAGGCTSGHGISGMAGMSKCSVVSTGCLFGGALVVGLVMG